MSRPTLAVDNTTPGSAIVSDAISVLVDEAIAEIGREVGPLDLMQRIAVHRAVFDLVARLPRSEWWDC